MDNKLSKNDVIKALEQLSAQTDEPIKGFLMTVLNGLLWELGDTHPDNMMIWLYSRHVAKTARARHDADLNMENTLHLMLNEDCKAKEEEEDKAKKIIQLLSLLATAQESMQTVLSNTGRSEEHLSKHEQTIEGMASYCRKLLKDMEIDLE